eukprot:1138763-Pelagomonas_calceolata.AAC.3
MRDDLQLIRDKTTELEIKVDRDINELKSSVEKGKNDTVRLLLFVSIGSWIGYRMGNDPRLGNNLLEGCPGIYC